MNRSFLGTMNIMRYEINMYEENPSYFCGVFNDLFFSSYKFASCLNNPNSGDADTRLFCPVGKIA
jgi:hypothetical protein